MLLGLLIHWNVTGRPQYPSMGAGQTIAYISDVGAESLKPLFIAGSCVTTIFLDASFLSERWLRHRGRLAQNLSRTEKVLSGLSMAFALLGTAGLILLSIFDTLRHPTLHDIFLLLFMVGYVLSAIFICWEYQRLGIRTSPFFFPFNHNHNTDGKSRRFPPTPHPPHLVLDKAYLYPTRSCPRHRLRILHLQKSIQRRRSPRMGYRIHLHILCLQFLHRFDPSSTHEAFRKEELGRDGE